MAPGKFITLEGGEGAGKSTQRDHLAERLREAGIDVIATREPGGAPGAELIRGLLVEGAPDKWEPITEALLHFAARTEHLAKTVRPALEKGSWVISDRFADSTMAYQGIALGLGRETVQRLYDLAVGDLKPDLTLILDLAVDEGLKRANGRGKDAPSLDDRYEKMGRAFHARLRDAFLEIAKAEPERCVVVDAAPSESTVQEAIWDAISGRLLPAGKNRER